MTKHLKNLKNIKIIDNFLEKETFKKLQDSFLSDEFPWFYNESKITYSKKFHKTYSPIKGYESQYPHQFTHMFFGGDRFALTWSKFTFNITPLLNKIKPRVWIRVKSNLSSINSKPLVGGWHCDMITNDKRWSDTTTAFFYINTNNGYTMFEDGKKIPSIENRLVVIPNNLMHTGVSQTDTKIRVVLNLNYLEERNNV